MNLPRNEYTRHCARQSGKLRNKAQKLRVSTIVRQDRPEWISDVRRYHLDDPECIVERANMARSEAYRWRHAWWCPIEVGEEIEAGLLTIKGLFAGLVIHSTIITFGAVIGVLLTGLMYIAKLMFGV